MIFDNNSTTEIDGVKMSFGVEQKTTLKDRVLCSIGVHEYRWAFDSCETIYASIPDDAKCVHCNKVHNPTEKGL